MNKLNHCGTLGHGDESLKKFKLRKKTVKVATVSVVLLMIVPMVLFFFNNCAPQGQGILGSVQPQGEVISQSVKTAPFAYDIAIDTISYNSCISETVKSSEIHGIKIGANEGYVDTGGSAAVRAGVKLRSDFLQYIGANFKPDYPEKTVGSAQIERILSQSDLNKDAYLNFGVRNTTNLRAVPDLILPGANGTSIYGRNGRDVFVFDRQFHSGLMGYNLTKNVIFNEAGAVLAEGTRLFNLSDTNDPVNLESRFGYNNTEDASYVKVSDTQNPENYGYREQYAEYVRAKFNSNTYLLAATFAGNQDPPDVDDGKVNHLDRLKRPLKADGTIASENKAFGRGFQLKFDSVNAAAEGWNKLKNRLTGVREINLDTGVETGGTSWSCENYLIVRPEQWNSNILSTQNGAKKDTQYDAACTPFQADDLTADRLNRLKRLRRHYQEGQWNIGLFVPAGVKSGTYIPPARTGLQMCVSPKAVDCYLPTTGILYDPLERFTVDVGIQYDSSQECYLTMGSYGSGTEAKKKMGRCAQFASICVRNSTNF
jgi:hypothetical protein